MSTVRVTAPGTRFKYKSGLTWSVAIGVTGIPGQDISTGDVETQELDPYSAGTTPAPAAMVFFKTFAGGWKDAGECPLEMNLTQVQYAAFLALAAVSTEILIAIHFKNGYAFVCSAYVKGLGVAAAEGDNMVKAPVTFKLTGTPTFVTHAVADAL